jgi:hypothetical protein
VSKLFSLVILGFFAFSMVLAQDATKVERTHYKLAFENDNVQVVYIHYGPHEKSKLHSHPQGVVVNITEAHLLFTDPDGKVQEVYAKPGEARWFPAFRHTVENLGETQYSGVYIGVKDIAGGRGSTKQGAPKLDEHTAKILATYLLEMRSPQQTPSDSPR